MTNEYRVLWQREGKSKRCVLYQTLAGAERCRDVQTKARLEMDWLDVLIPEIVWGPVIEVREVGKWRTT